MSEADAKDTTRFKKVGSMLEPPLKRVVLRPMDQKTINAINDIKNVLNLSDQDDIPPSETWPKHLQEKYDW